MGHRSPHASTHRPQRALRSLEQGLVHRKWKPRLTRCRTDHRQAAQAQRIVEVRRVDLRPLERQARPQPRRCSPTSVAPHLYQGAVLGAILQTGSME